MPMKRKSFLIHFCEQNEEISRNCLAVIGATSAMAKTKSNKIQSALDSALGAFIYLQLILLPCFYWPH